MPSSALARERLFNQQLAAPRFRAVAELVRWLGAVQAQDGPAALWAIGQRLPGSCAQDVEDAVAARAIVRTWPMRGTLHYLAAEDVRWMLGLLAPRVVRRAASRYRQLGLDETVLKKARRLAEKALRGGRRLTRPELYAAFARGGVSPADERGLHLIGYLAQERHLCFGPRQGNQPTLVLLEEWLPAAADPPREEALARVATRYFASHGPAALADFAWWTGLSQGESRRAIDAAGAQLASETRAGVTLWRAAGAPPARRARGPVVSLLPPWDELLVAYRDRSAAFAALPPRLRGALMVIGKATLVVDGQVRGLWRRAVGPAHVTVAVSSWGPLGPAERRGLEAAAARYGRFLGREVRLTTTSSSASRRSP